jgi:hypothetical protein
MMRATVSELPPGAKPTKILMLCVGKLLSAAAVCAWAVKQDAAPNKVRANKALRRATSKFKGMACLF